jgi:hypothetical protein
VENAGKGAISRSDAVSQSEAQAAGGWLQAGERHGRGRSGFVSFVHVSRKSICGAKLVSFVRMQIRTGWEFSNGFD